MSMIEVKTAELSGAALSWAFLTVSYGDGPDWTVRDGVFGVLYTKDVLSGLDSVTQVEEFQQYDPESLYGAEKCRAIVAAKLGDTVRIPAELVQ